MQTRIPTTAPLAAALLMAGLTPVPARAGGDPELLWITQFGTPESDVAQRIAPDGSGGAYVGGRTSGDLAGPNQGEDDIWLARYDASGTQLWLTQAGSSTSDWITALALADQGGFLAAGYTLGAFPGPHKGETDGWVARFDPGGGLVWIVQFGTSKQDTASSVMPDGAGGAFVSGMTQGSLGGANQGGSDAFIARYDAPGSLLWTIQFGTPENDSAGALAPDGAGGLFVAGRTNGALGGPNAGKTDVWVARYDADGERIWIDQFGSSESDVWVEGVHMVADGAGGVFIAASTYGSLGGPHQGSSDAWLARYDSGGGRLWLVQFGTDKYEETQTIAADGAGGAFVGGYTQGDLGGPNQGVDDAWLVRFDASGNQTWSSQLGTPGSDRCRAAALVGKGALMIGGSTTGPLGGPPQGLADIWIARLGFADACYPDLDGNGVLNLFDFLGFSNLFNAADPGADCDGNGLFNLFDFLCFTNAFNEGC